MGYSFISPSFFDKYKTFVLFLEVGIKVGREVLSVLQNKVSSERIHRLPTLKETKIFKKIDEIQKYLLEVSTRQNKVFEYRRW